MRYTMANQKSQIYPIQLQGAELNLNKFDGEIKQYSGFNKNNSPFVGGGLSPIFRKDETVEGATSKNTYIAPNGDVYKLTENRLYKNGTSIKTFYSEFFCDKEELNIEEENLITMRDKNYYVYVSSSSKLTAKFYNNFNNTWETKVITTLNNEYDYNVDIFRFSSYSYYDIYFVTVKYNNSITVYSFVRSNSLNYDNNNLSFSLSGNVKVSDWPVFIEYCYDNNDINIYLNEDSLPFIKKYHLDPLNNVSSNRFVFLQNYATIQDAYNVDFYVRGSTNYYRVVNNLFYFTGDTQTTASNTRFHIAGIFYYGSGFVIKDTLQIIGYELLTRDEGFFFNVIKKYGAICCILTESMQYWTNGNQWGFGVTFDENEKPHAYCGMQFTNRILYNNENISGVCFGVENLYSPSSPGATENFSAYPFLVSDWNEVSEILCARNGCFNTRAEVIYKTFDNKIYNVEYSTKRIIKKINNLLVFNFCYSDNCLDLETGKFKDFGMAWNNYLPLRGSLNYDFSTDKTNISYIASSINEYDLQNNPSIILNPIPISVKIRTDITYKHGEYHKKLFGNLYIGDDTDVLYRLTFFKGYDSSGRILFNYEVIQKDNLIELPFPKDTNGNVQYSPSLFSEIASFYGNEYFIKSGNSYYPLMKYNNLPVMSFYLASGIDNLQNGFIIQGQFYGIINNGLYSLRYSNGVVEDVDFVVSVEGLKFCGNTPYQAFFFSKTNRCLYIFNGANVLQQSQFIDIYSDIKFYKYNPATHSIFMVTDDCVLVFSSFGTFRLDVPDVEEIYLLENGVVFLNNVGTFMRIKYYNTEDGYTKQNVILETCFYGMNNQTVTINDCLYMRLFSEEHESGNIEVSAVTLANEGKKTECTTFKIKPSDWDKETHSIYLRYQPKEQRGLGISFKINSPFKICSLSVGSIADSILIDKVSKGAINAPYNNKSSIEEW